MATGQARLRFTDTYLLKLKVPQGQRELIRFEAGTGLGVRVSASGHIAFIVQTRLKDGRRWRETLGPYGGLTIEDARSIAQERSADAKRGGPGGDLFQKFADERTAARLSEQSKKLTLRVLAERWACDYLSQKRRMYAVRARTNVTLHFANLLDVPATLVTKRAVKDALEVSLLNGGPSAARNAAASLRALYRWALSEELIANDPLNGLKLPPGGDDRERVLTIDEARRIYAAATSLAYPAGHFTRLLMLSGCRRAEIAGLRWSEIVEETDGKAIHLPPERTKNNSGHHVPLSAAALEVISECQRHRIVGSPFVLTSDGRRPFANYGRLKGWLDEGVSEAGAPISDWRLHDFRRTLVSHLAARPFRYDPTVLDLLLGHQPTQLTPVARICAREKHLDVRREALEAWGGHLTQPPAVVLELPPLKRPPSRSKARRRS